MRYFPDIIPDISEESITDRAGSNPMSKTLLIIQVGWFCANCLLRLIQKLPLSLLEVSTAAHGFCTLLTYLVWWSKPQNIAEATPMKGERAREVHALLMCSQKEYSLALNRARRMAAGHAPRRNEQERIDLAANALQHILPSSRADLPQNNFHTYFFSAAPGTSHTYLLPGRFLCTRIPMIIAPILYGLPHFLGWSELFPTPLEKLFWRISTSVVSASGFFLMSALSMVNQDLLYGLIVLITSIVYVAASGFLLGESLRQLGFLEQATYQLASWPGYWPYLL